MEKREVALSGDMTKIYVEHPTHPADRDVCFARRTPVEVALAAVLRLERDLDRVTSQAAYAAAYRAHDAAVRRLRALAPALVVGAGMRPAGVVRADVVPVTWCERATVHARMVVKGEYVVETWDVEVESSAP